MDMEIVKDRTDKDEVHTALELAQGAGHARTVELLEKAEPTK